MILQLDRTTRQYLRAALYAGIVVQSTSAACYISRILVLGR